MKVGIDTFGCGRGGSNEGYYLKSLLGAVRSVAVPEGESLEVELFGPEAWRYDYVPDEDAFGAVKVGYASVNLPESPRGVRLWHAFGCNSFFRRQGYDAVVFLSPLLCPLRCKVPSVAVVDDALSKSLSEMGFLSRMRRLLPLRSLSAALVPSQFVKKDLKSLRVGEPRVRVAHMGVDHSAFYPRGGDSFEGGSVDISPFSIRRPYFVYASRMSGASKRHCELIRAFSAFKSRTSLPHRLVLAGGEGEWSSRVAAEAAASPFASDIFITGFFPHGGYPDLFAGSEGCLHPALMDGAAMPVLEAMSSGVPVACARSGAVPEISGGNVVYFDGDDEDSLSRGIERLATLSQQERGRLVSEGLSWAARFTWERTAAELFSAVGEAVSARRGRR